MFPEQKESREETLNLNILTVFQYLSRNQLSGNFRKAAWSCDKINVFFAVSGEIFRT